MTDEEFKRWYRAHVEAFPSVHSWLAGYPVDGAGELPTRKGILAGWLTTLRDCEFSDCLEAVRLLQRGERELPRFAEEHARAVRRISAELGATRRAEIFKSVPLSTREESFLCLMCRDKGLVTCWHPRSMAAMREGIFGRARTNYQTVVRCTCMAGDRWSKVPCRYEPRLWIPVDGLSSVDAVQALKDWAENYTPTHGGTEWNY